MSLLKRIEKKDPAQTTPPVSVGGNSMPPPVESMSRQRQTPAPPVDKMVELRARLLSKIIAELDPKLDIGRSDDLRRNVEELFNQFLAEESDVVLGRVERQRLLDQLTAEIMGFGPLEPLLRDNTISEVMVNGPNMIYIERNGKIERVSARFDSDMHIMRIIDRIVAPLGRRVDEGQPFVDARLPDGSRVNIIIPPLALNGPTITIRKFAKIPLTSDDLIQRGAFTKEFDEFVKACVKAR
ncbi:MAG: type II secretion system protein E, partial [Chloroflexi bacterium UTCFX4]